jgi:hypothetical protein
MDFKEYDRFILKGNDAYQNRILWKLICMELFLDVYR